MRYIALLRAVNVGGRTVKMDRLRVLFEEMKLRNVETFIASGNVIFETTASAAPLEVEDRKASRETLWLGADGALGDRLCGGAMHAPFSDPPLPRLRAFKSLARSLAKVATAARQHVRASRA